MKTKISELNKIFCDVQLSKFVRFISCPGDFMKLREKNLKLLEYKHTAPQYAVSFLQTKRIFVPF